jgi:FixJ family two-component response regulator
MRSAKEIETQGASATLPEPTVFVVDDDEAVRESLCWLGRSVGLNVAPFASAQEFLQANEHACAGCLVLDVRLPGMSGLDLQRELAARRITLPIIMITGFGDVPTAVSALTAGAIDFIEKPFSRQLLLDRIRHALDLDRAARSAQAERDALAARLALLTPRERQVVDLVVVGKTNKVMAMELGISEKTIEVHRAHAMKKMQVECVAELVRATSVLRLG